MQPMDITTWALAAIVLAYVAWAIRIGRIWAKGAKYYRNEEPKLFWATAAVYIALAVALMLMPVCFHLKNSN